MFYIWAGKMAQLGERSCHQVVKYLLSMCETLGLVPSSGKKNIIKIIKMYH